jgi:hypothetical protein
LSEQLCRNVRQSFERVGHDEFLDGAPRLSPHVAQQLGRNGPAGSHQVFSIANRQFAAHVRMQLAVERLDLGPGGGGRLLQAQSGPWLNVLLEFIAPLLAGVPETCAIPCFIYESVRCALEKNKLGWCIFTSVRTRGR